MYPLARILSPRAVLIFLLKMHLIASLNSSIPKTSISSSSGDPAIHLCLSLCLLTLPDASILHKHKHIEIFSSDLSNLSTTFLIQEFLNLFLLLPVLDLQSLNNLLAWKYSWLRYRKLQLIKPNIQLLQSRDLLFEWHLHANCFWVTQFPVFFSACFRKRSV